MRELAKAPAGRQPSVVRLVRLLMHNPLWADRLAGKTPESWKRTYNRWRMSLQKRDSVQAENVASDPCFHCTEALFEKFYQATGVKYSPPRDGEAIKPVSGEAAPRPPGGAENNGRPTQEVPPDDPVLAEAP